MPTLHVQFGSCYVPLALLGQFGRSQGILCSRLYLLAGLHHSKYSMQLWLPGPQARLVKWAATQRGRGLSNEIHRG